jgi:outer membrane murein-binding lipoprotein Lpp
MKIASGSEAAALNALKFARPRVFHKGRPTIVSVRNKSRLNVIDTYAAWNPGGDGVKDYVIEKMNLLEDSISDQIGNTFEAESTAHWIASKCLTATVSFLNQLFGCIEAIYKRLFNFSKFTTEQAWSLTTQVLDRILADLYSPKDNIAQSLKTRNTPANCAQVLFAAFKTHDIMASYVAHKFENHPSVSTEYVKFLATNSGSEKVEKLSSSLEEMKTAMKELKSKSNTASEEAKAATVESKNAGKKADAASSRFSDILKQLETLSAKVKNLEKK